jgi:DNA-binding response OmpR family regulator
VNDERLILVVEDDDATRSFLLDNLAADGFRVAGASSPQEGVRAIEVRQPSLVVLDLAFENGSGLDLLDRLRAADGLASRLDPDLPVIVLTGRSGEADRVRSFARGADDHLNKPLCHFLPRLRAQFEVRASSIGERRSSGAADPAQDCCPSRGAGSVTLRFCSSCGGKTLVGVG